MDVLPASLLRYLQSFDLLTGALVAAAAAALGAVLFVKRRFRRFMLVPFLLVAGYAAQVAANVLWMAMAARPAPAVGAYVAAIFMVATLLVVWREERRIVDKASLDTTV